LERPPFQPGVSEQTALRADFRAAVLAGVANCPASSRFRVTLKDFLAERTGKDSKLSLNRIKILPLHKQIWEQFESTVGAVDHMMQGEPKDLMTILPGPRLEKSVAKALAADLISHLTETNEAFKTRLHNISLPLALQKLADELGKKLKGKNIRSIADLKKEAKTDAERSIVDLLFGSGYGQSMADKLIGLDKANYLRNSILLGSLKIQSHGAGYNLSAIIPFGPSALLIKLAKIISKPLPV
jgi:hypothetical protein